MTKGMIALMLALLLATAIFGGVQMQCGLNKFAGQTCIWSLVIKKFPTSTE